MGLLRRPEPPYINNTGSIITGDDLEAEDTVRYYDSKRKRWYGMIQARNNHPTATLLNAYLNLLEHYAGKPGQADCIRYEFITEEQARKLVEKPYNQDYTRADFKEFKFKKKAKLLQRRTKSRLTDNKVHGPHYAVDQRIILGTVAPQSTKFIAITTIGGEPVYHNFGHNCQFGGDTMVPDETKLPKIKARKVKPKR